MCLKAWIPDVLSLRVGTKRHLDHGINLAGGQSWPRSHGLERLWRENPFRCDDNAVGCPRPPKFLAEWSFHTRVSQSVSDRHMQEGNIGVERFDKLKAAGSERVADRRPMRPDRQVSSAQAGRRD
jgi:hypothetical protein